MRHKNIFHKSTIILIIGLLFIVDSPLMAKGDIYAVGCTENYPYEYVNNEGMPAGFSVDLLNAICEESNIKCRIELVPYERYIHLKTRPDVDLILGMIKNNEDKKFTFFKANLKIHFSIFSNPDSEFYSINDLHNKKVIIAAHNIIASQVINEIKRIIRTEFLKPADDIDAFTILKRRECDVVFMSGPSAKKIITNQNLIGIKEIPVSIGFFDYGFGIKNKDDTKEKIITSGYSNIILNGKYNNIYSKWFVDISQNSFLSETGIYLSAGIFFLILFILFILINSFILRKRIREKTDELHFSMNELEKVQVLLKESEKRFKRIFDKTPSGLMILNPAGKIILFNEEVINIFGVNDPHEISDLDVINSPIATEWFKTRLKNYNHVSVELKFDFDMIRTTGYYSTYKTGIMILEMVILPVEINTGSPEHGYICQFSDTTREQLLIEEIKKKQRKLELIFESVRDGLWEWNLETGKVIYNRKFFQFLGYKKESYPDDINTLLGFVHHNERESVKNELNEKISNGRSFNIEYRMVMNNGKVVNVRSRGEVIEWDDNLKARRVIGIQNEIIVKRDVYTRINLFKNKTITDIEKTDIFDVNILNGKTILIADDNYLIYMHLSEVLKKHNVKSLYASNGLEAVEIMKKDENICIAILDQYMPGLDGISALREIRKINPDIPLIIQTGELNESLNEKFYNEGFNGVLGKPVEENLFIETIYDIIESFFCKKI